MGREESAGLPKTVLVLEDDKQFRSLLVDVLHGAGVKVLEASHANEATSLLAQHNVGLAIVDYGLPDIDGATWISQVRASGNQVPIIFLSGTWCDQQTFVKLRTVLRVSLILQKPILPELFLDQIGGLLPRPPSQPALRQSPTAAQTEAEGKEGDSQKQTPEQADLRLLLKSELSASEQASSAVSEGVRSPETYGKDAMRMSSTRLPAFENNLQKQSYDPQLSTAFKDLPLSTDSAREMAIIESAEPDFVEQIAAFRQRLDVERVLKAARASYARSLPGHVNDLVQAISELRTDPTNPVRLDEAVQIAHRFKGTAGSLGFPEIGKAAATIEQLLLHGSVSDTKIENTIWTRIDNGLRLCGEIAESRAILHQAEEVDRSQASLHRILLIGPYETFCGLSKELAQTKIGEAYWVEDIESAIQESTAQRFDCVMIDMQVFGTADPAPTLERARQHQFFRMLPVAFIGRPETNLAEAELVYLGGELGLPAGPDVDTAKAAIETLLAMRDATKPRVLTVDDDVVLTSFIEGTLLALGYAGAALNEPIRILEMLEEFEPDLVLLDVVMPGISGYDVCRLLRSLDRWRHLRVLFLTSKSSAEARAAAFKAGGDDFLVKPILTEELMTRVRSCLDSSTSLQERAGVDQWTGLLTRRAFQNGLQEQIERAKAAGSNLAVAFLELDASQDIALSHGFLAQQLLLKDLAALLRTRFRLNDLRTAWSESIFAVAAANVEANLLRQALSELALAFSKRDAGEGEQAASKRKLRVGVAELIVDAQDAERLLQCAYQRMVLG